MKNQRPTDRNRQKKRIFGKVGPVSKTLPTTEARNFCSRASLVQGKLVCLTRYSACDRTAVAPLPCRKPFPSASSRRPASLSALTILSLKSASNHQRV